MSELEGKGKEMGKIGYVGGERSNLISQCLSFS
jgi:hypothetical protein